MKYQSYLMKTVGNSSILNTPENNEIMGCNVLVYNSSLVGDSFYSSLILYVFPMMDSVQMTLLIQYP